MSDGKTWTDPLITALNRDGGTEDLSAEMISGGWIDDLARAANEHQIMITLTFVPGTLQEDTDD